MKSGGFFKKIVAISYIFFLDYDSRRFKKFVRGRIPNYNSTRQILVEFELPPDSLFGAAFFLPILSEELNANCVGYQMSPRTLFWQLKRRIYFTLSSTRKLIGKRFVYFPSAPKTYKTRKSMSLQKSKEEVLNHHYKGVRIGDLAYDWYLAKYHEPTIVIDESRFQILLSQFEDYVDRFLHYINTNDVVAICVSHSVYHFAIPARIGIKLDIPVYQINLESIFFLDSTNPIAHTSEKRFPLEFQNLNRDSRELGKAKAKVRLLQRIAGEPGVDIPYMSTSAFAKTSEIYSVATGKSEIKVLIAAHDFYDSPHFFGDFFYPDFFEWIQALVKISSKCKYDWYIKTHPFLRGNGREILRELVQNVPRVTLLPQTMSHPEIIELGITHALTVYGSIAHEYPILGIPVINASQNNPHSEYDFSVTPQSREEYENIVMHLDEFEHQIHEQEILEYYFMKNIFSGKSWLINDYARYTRETGFPEKQVSRKVFTYLLSNDQLFSAVDLEKRITDFVRGKSYMLKQPT